MWLMYSTNSMSLRDILWQAPTFKTEAIKYKVLGEGLQKLRLLEYVSINIHTRFQKNIF